MDGNQKCYRQRCYSDEGEIQLENNIIHVGCDQTPIFKEIHIFVLNTIVKELKNSIEEDENYVEYFY